MERHDEASADELRLARRRCGGCRGWMPHLGARLRLRVRARDVMLAKSAPPDLSALNIFPAVVADIGGGEDGRSSRSASTATARRWWRGSTRYSVERLGLAPGVPVHALVKSVALDRRSLSGPLQASPGADAEANDG